MSLGMNGVLKIDAYLKCPQQQKNHTYLISYKIDKSLCDNCVKCATISKKIYNSRSSLAVFPFILKLGRGAPKRLKDANILLHPLMELKVLALLIMS